MSKVRVEIAARVGLMARSLILMVLSATVLLSPGAASAASVSLDWEGVVFGSARDLNGPNIWGSTNSVFFFDDAAHSLANWPSENEAVTSGKVARTASCTPPYTVSGLRPLPREVAPAYRV